MMNMMKQEHCEMFRVSSRYSVSFINTFLQYVISAPEHISCDLHFILAFSMKMIINRLNLRSGPQTRICGGREETCRRWLFQWIVFPSVSVSVYKQWCRPAAESSDSQQGSHLWCALFSSWIMRPFYTTLVKIFSLFKHHLQFKSYRLNFWGNDAQDIEHDAAIKNMESWII